MYPVNHKEKGIIATYNGSVDKVGAGRRHGTTYLVQQGAINAEPYAGPH